MFAGLDVTGLATYNPSLSWADVRKLRAMTQMKLVIKGIVTAEDAALCIEHGADGIIVSNHGGRAEESGRATIDCLPEVVEAARGRVPVLIDGGFRRGTDVSRHSHSERARSVLGVLIYGDSLRSASRAWTGYLRCSAPN